MWWFDEYVCCEMTTTIKLTHSLLHIITFLWWWFSHKVVSNSCDPHGLYRPAFLSIRFSRQEYWSGLPFPSPGDLPNPRIEPGSPALQADSLPTELPGKPVKLFSHVQLFVIPWMKPTRHVHPWNFLGKSTGVSCHFLLQGIYLTWGLNLGLPNCRQTLYPLSHQGSPAFLYMW